MAMTAPTENALLAQLRELNERSRTYGRQLWQVPFAYIAAAGIVIMQASDGKHGPLVLAFTLSASGAVGIFVVWHLVSLCSAAHRSWKGLTEIEALLSLSPKQTRWSPGHLYALLTLTILASLSALIAAAYRFRC
jgi:hypothetical protein